MLNILHDTNLVKIFDSEENSVHVKKGQVFALHQ